MKCQANKDKNPNKLFMAIFSYEPCNKEAKYKNKLNQLLCEECAIYYKTQHESGNTILSMLVGSKEYPLYPIQ